MKCSWDYIIEDFKRQKQEAKKAGFIEVIKRMIENGESIDKIKLYSGLSLKEIKKIEKDLNIVV